MKCRHCQVTLQQKILDLGNTPPSNSFLNIEDLSKPEMFFPLKVFVCHECWLIQTVDYVDARTVFPDSYVYFSSTSKSWLEHAREYVDMIVGRLELDGESKVIEIASNDGYLLRNFNHLGIPNTGIEPTKSTADAAEEIGVTTIRSFFGSELASELVATGERADLIIGNNVYAHVPDINDFTLGLSRTLKPHGVVTLEFPHAVNLITGNQFDTVYHEHFSYLSLTAVKRIFSEFGMRIFDVETISTHGGSLRVYGCLKSASWITTDNVDAILQQESRVGMKSYEIFDRLQASAETAKNEFLEFLLKERSAGRHVVGYGAAAKGNTLLNFAGVKSDLLRFVVDGAPSKHGKYLPGSHIPVLSPESLDPGVVDSVVIFPWNLVREVSLLLFERFGREINVWTAIPRMKRVAHGSTT